MRLGRQRSRARAIHLATELAFFPQFIHTPPPYFPLPSVPSFPQERYYPCKSWRDGVYPWQLSLRWQTCSLEGPQGRTTPALIRIYPCAPHLKIIPFFSLHLFFLGFCFSCCFYTFPSSYEKNDHHF